MSSIFTKPWPTLSNILDKLSLINHKHIALLIAAYTLYLTLHRLLIYPYLLSPLRHIPGPPTGNLLLGQSRLILQSEPGIPQREWVKQYGPLVRLVGPIGLERLIITDPEMLHHVLVKDWLRYPRPGFLRHILGLVAGYGLLTVTGDEHRQMRRAMNPAFSIPNLMSQTYMYWDSIDGLVDLLKKETNSGKIIPVYDWMSKVTLDIICQTAFGYNSDSLHNPHNELSVAYEKLIALQSGPNIARLILLMVIPGIPKLLSSKWAYNHRSLFDYLPSIFYGISTLIESMYHIRQISNDLLQSKLRESAHHVSDIDAKRDVMSILVRAQREERVGGEGYKMNDRAMMDQVLTFLGAGHETTASGLTWTLWLLANDKESQRKLREELKPVMADNPHPDYRTLKDFKWLDCVVMESLRVMPPVPLTVRITKEPTTINNILIPKGTIFHIPIRVVNTWNLIWGSNAEEYHPERWLNLPKTYNPTFSLLSFIAGPHACIGKTMAINEMKAVLAGLIVNFEFDLAYEGQTAKPAAAITMKPTDGMPLRVRRL